MSLRGFGLVSATAWVWRVAFEFGRILNPCRFTALIVVLGGAVLLVTAQGQEIVVRLAEAHFGAKVLFVFAISLWAFQSWYWSHYILELRFPKGRPPGRLGWFATHLPRWLGLSAFLLAAAAIYLSLRRAPSDAQSGYYPVLGAVVAAGLGFGAVLLCRDRLTRWLESKTWAKGRLVADPSAKRHFADYPLSRALVIFTAVQAIGISAWVICDPAPAGALLGAPAIFFLALASIAPVGSYFVIRSQRLRFPVVTTLGLVALAMSFFNDNHQVRPYLEDGHVALPGARPTLEEAVERWRGCGRNGELGAPLVVVATAGGGLRAALWTATVLGMLQDTYPAFADRLFAISGVSGGALGATVHVAHLREHGFGCRSSGGPGDGAVRYVSFAAEARRVLAQDFLGPTLAGLLYPDLMQRFLPGGFMPDRALALEQAFERGWRIASARTTAGLAAPFQSLWFDAAGQDAGHRPALLLNGTHQETGRRIITSNLRVLPETFVDALDFYDLVDGDIRASTAVTNSARFPYVTPAGTLKRAGANTGHIVDGGFFENFGAITAAEVLRTAMWAAGNRQPLPLVIMISSDPELGDLSPGPARAATRPKEPEPATGGNEILAPPLALYATRNARGTLAALELERLASAYFEDNRGAFAHFRMCAVADAGDPALGWVLSRRSEIAIAERMLCACGNEAAFAAVMEALDRRARRTLPVCERK